MQTILSILGKIGFDWKIALVNLVNFLIILFVLKVFAFGPLEKMLAKRKKLVDEGIANALNAETIKLKAEEERLETLRIAKLEATQILERAKKQADQAMDDITLRAKEEQGRLIASAKKEGEQVVNQMKESFEKKASELVVNTAMAVIKETVDEQTQEKISKEFTSTAQRHLATTATAQTGKPQ